MHTQEGVRTCPTILVGGTPVDNPLPLFFGQLREKRTLLLVGDV
jgi:hypothetical protein